MSLWKSSDANTSVPKFAPAITTRLSPTQTNSNTLYGNVQTSAIVTNQAIGVFGANTAETGNATGEGKRLAHAGWVLRRAGSGPIASITGSGGSGYGASGFLTITGGNGPLSVTGNVAGNAAYTNTASGWTITINNGGLYANTPVVTGPGGTAATFTVTMTGRANRVHYETLVAMSSITGDDASATVLP